MNKNKLFKVFVMIAFIMCSCEDNFDPKMYGTLNVSNYPVTEAEYESFMMTCYMPFTTTWTYWIGAGTSGNQHGWYIPAGGVLKFFDYPTDEVAVWNNGWGGGYYFLSKADFSQCVYYASGTLSDENPNHFPKVSEISYFTNVIGTLEKASTEVVSEERKREFIAEARLCRGLMMYYLLHVYGPVPLIVDPNDLINPSKLENLVRPTLQQMTEWIMADFEYAYQYIADTQPEQGRYNKDYARVCIMRHCLNEGYYMSGYYQKAIDMYNELKGRYSLFKKGDNPYIEQFKNANNFNSEVIMAVSCDETADGTNKSGNFNPLMMLATPDNAARVDDQGNPTPFYLQGQGWGQTFNVSPKFWDTYDPSDKRREVILTKYYTTAGTWIDRNTTTWDGFIINKFPVETAPDLGRYTRDYARFCLMKHCLNEGEHMEGYYQRAMDMYNELNTGKYDLFKTGSTPYVDLFKNANKFNKEIIMAVSCSPAADGNPKHGNANPFLMWALPSDVAKGDPFPMGGGWFQAFSMDKKYYDAFESNDGRLKTIVTSYKDKNGVIINKDNLGVRWNGYIMNKFPQETMTTFQGTDIPLARWADVLLMYAEAEVRKTGTVPSVAAINAVNQVRNRAGLANLPAVATNTKDAFLDAILIERGHELFYEGNRKIDLIRFNKYAQEMYKAKGVMPTHQYMPIPNYAVEQAVSYGKELKQTWERPGWAEDKSKAQQNIN